MPLKVIELPGRGRNRTGPTLHWPPKRLRHHPCAPRLRQTRKVSPPFDEATVPAVDATRKVARHKPSLAPNADMLQKLKYERHALRAAFDDYATTLQPPVKKHVHVRSRRCVLPGSSTTPNLHEHATHGTKRTTADRRFCQRSAHRGKARGSIRPDHTFSFRDLRRLEAMNLGAPSEILTVQDE